MQNLKKNQKIYVLFSFLISMLVLIVGVVFYNLNFNSVGISIIIISSLLFVITSILWVLFENINKKQR